MSSDEADPSLQSSAPETSVIAQIVVTLPTADRDATNRFYQEVLGFVHVVHHRRPGDFTLDLLRHESGIIIEIVAGAPITAGDIGSGAPFLSFFVSDLMDVKHHLGRCNVGIESAIEMADGVEMVRVRDPSGALISFVGGFASGL